MLRLFAIAYFKKFCYNLYTKQFRNVNCGQIAFMESYEFLQTKATLMLSYNNAISATTAALKAIIHIKQLWRSNCSSLSSHSIEFVHVSL